MSLRSPRVAAAGGADAVAADAGAAAALKIFESGGVEAPSVSPHTSIPAAPLTPVDTPLGKLGRAALRLRARLASEYRALASTSARACAV